MAMNHDVRQVGEEDVKYIQALPVAYREVNSDDEINLLDLWLVIIKRKKLFFGMLFLSLLIGGGYALLKPHIFNFSTVLEIGSKSQQGSFVPVEKLASIVSKINKGYVFLGDARNREKSSGKSQVPAITANLLDDTSIIELSIKGPVAAKDVYFQYLTQVTGKIIREHKQIISISAANLERLKSRVEVNIDSIDRRKGLSGEEKAKLINGFHLELSGVEMKLANLKETKVIVKPAQSIEPVGRSKKLIVFISIVVGVFLALFVVFVFEFLEKARNYAAEKSQSIN